MTGPTYLYEVISFTTSLFVAIGIGFLFGFGNLRERGLEIPVI